MLKLILLIIAPILSLVIVTLGSGFLTTLLTLRLHEAGSSTSAIGFLTAAYYLGMVVGSFRTHKLIRRVGNIRVYAAFAAVLAIAVMVQGLWVNGTAWVVLRFISGFCIAALYIAIESWMLVAAPPEKRGQILSLYMISFYAALGGGQFLLNVSNPDTLIPFCIIVILSALSIVPVSMTYAACPSSKEISALSFFRLYKISPSGVVGCFAAGLMTGVIYGLMPLFAKLLHFSTAYVSWVMGLIIFGAMALQFPIGKISDVVPRRKVLAIISFASLLLAVALAGTAYVSPLVFLVIAFIFGGVSFTLYPISISHTCDYLEDRDIVAATQGLLLANGIGSILGPLFAPIFIDVFGPVGLFIYFAIISGLLGVFFIWRRTQKSAPPVEEQRDFVAVPRTSPVMTKLDPRAGE